MPNFKPFEQANPFITRDLSKCILCGKCIRADHELVVVGAIDFAHRGFASRPATVHHTGSGKIELHILRNLCIDLPHGGSRDTTYHICRHSRARERHNLRLLSGGMPACHGLRRQQSGGGKSLSPPGYRQQSHALRPGTFCPRFSEFPRASAEPHDPKGGRRNGTESRSDIMGCGDSTYSGRPSPGKSKKRAPEASAFSALPSVPMKRTIFFRKSPEPCSRQTTSTTADMPPAKCFWRR